MSHRVSIRGVALTLTALLLAVFATRSLVRPGLLVLQRKTALTADGRTVTIAILVRRHPLPLGLFPLHANDLHASVSEASTDTTPVTVHDLPEDRVAIELQAPVEAGDRRVVVRGRDGLVVLPVSFTADSRDTFGDGTPDWMRLHTASDRQTFRRAYTALAEEAADTPATKLPPEITDCASLLRYAYREALVRHDDRWYAQFAPGTMPSLGSVQQWNYPHTALGAALFRVRPGPFTPDDLQNGAFAQFADAKTLHFDDAYIVSRDLRSARPGDLIFYRVLEQDSQYHSMILSGDQSEWVIYHTGPMHDAQGRHPGEMRRVLLQDLLHHPDPRWRPVPGNANFLGVYRWNILREP